MRDTDVMQESLFTYRTLNDFVPANHPLRAIREIVNMALKAMDATFDAMYADSGRDSTPPEQRRRGLVLQTLFGLRSERLLCENLAYNMLYRWFVGLGLDRAVFDHSTYTQNRDRLIEHEIERRAWQVQQRALTGLQQHWRCP